MNRTKITKLLEQIKAYCPHTTDWKVFENNISYVEHGKELVIPVSAGSTPEEELQKLLDRIMPSPERLIEILSEPIDLTGDDAMILHRRLVRITLIDKALATGKITPEQHQGIYRTLNDHER